MPRLVTSLFVFAALFLGACGPVPSENGSVLHDIFTQDTGQRRHKATNEEILWTINMGGCTGHLLNTQYMMTANHCSPSAGATYTSGSSLAKGGGKDITVASKTECNSSLDYCILKITWKSGSAPTNQNFPPSIATEQSQVTMSTQADQGDFIFTVGFPGDQSSATYSEGQLKKMQGSNLVYNMGIINGNSGGGVWRKSDKMLVSLTNAGPNALNQAGWNNNDVNDSNHWNYGVGMWNAYSASSTLKTIFPNGINSETPPGGGSTGGGTTNPGGGGTTTPGGGTTTPGGGTTTGGGTSGGGSTNTPNPNDGNIYLALEHKSGTSSPLIWVSAPGNAYYAAMCVNQNDCNASWTQSTMAAEVGLQNGRKIFKFVDPTNLSPNTTITFVVSDSKNNLIKKRPVVFLAK